MKNKKLKWFLLSIVFLICLFIIPITLSKYTSTFNRKVTVKFRKPKYTIKFDANGGTGVMADMPMVYGKPQNLTTNTFTRTDYVFSGWNTQENGNGTPYADGVSVSNLTPSDGETVTLYAQWKAIYTITFDSNGGKPETIQTTAVEGTTVPRPATNPKKKNLVFVCWKDTRTGAEYDFSAPVTENIILEAEWREFILSNTVTGGQNFAQKLKTLANNNSSYPGYDYENKITKIEFDELGDKFEARNNSSNPPIIISDPGAAAPVYAWFDSGTIYFYTEAERIQLSGNMEKAFNKMTNLTDISALEKMDTRNVTNMNRMFQDSCKITDLTPLKDWEVSNVTDMTFMFGANVTNYPYMQINNLDALEDWNVSNVTSMNQMFKGCINVTSIEPLANWKVGKVTTFKQMFNRCGLLDARAIENWDVRAATDFGNMLNNMPALTSDGDKRPYFTTKPGTWNSEGTYNPTS